MAEVDREAIRAAADDIHGMCSDQGYSDAVAVLRDAAPALLTELERCEGDLAVAIAEATTARRALRIASAAHAVDHDALAAMTAALFDVAAPVQPEEQP